jgi:hypothetical protein
MATQSEHSRDAGVTFESTESPTKTKGAARQDDEVVSKQSERGRDAGVTFENMESHGKTKDPARRDDEVVSKQIEHGRDAGVTFGNAESRRPAAAPAPVENVVVSSHSEHGRDVVFGITEGHRQAGAPAPRKDGSLSSVLGSMMKLGQATAKFTFDQFQNGVYMLTDPGKALRRAQHSMDHLSRAMNEPVEEAASPKS